MSNGWIYVLTNSALPGLVKVGKTTSSPEKRAKELSGATGVPMQFEVFASYSVLDCDEAEKSAHKVLSTIFGRPNDNREFFTGGPEEICKVLEQELDYGLSTDDSYSSNAPIPERFISGLERINNKQFAIGCAEIENNLESLLSNDPGLVLECAEEWISFVLGMYLAACAAIKRDPKFRRQIFSERLQKKILNYALHNLKDSSTHPEIELERFISNFQ
jgi:hypothetical protein